MSTADRIINRRGRKHFRRSYSLTEVRMGLLCLLGLAAVAAWVAHRGANPDPALFANTPDMLDPGQAPAERGPLPTELASSGWQEGRLSTFDGSNLYEKINGRADYFKSRGFERMWFLSLTSAADAADAIDLELYDMGNAENARGAYGGERPEAIEPKQRGGDLWHIDRNALFLTNDRYYLRAIGSRESAGVSKQLVELQGRFHAGNAAASVKPWSQRLFVDGLGLPVGAVSFAKENAFSFAFANNLYSARRSDDSEWFVTVAPSDADADALAAQFVEGFASLGVRKPAEGIGWVEDRYLHDLSTAVSHGRFVLGVRGVKDAKGGKALLDELRRAVDALDEDAKSAALGGAAPDPAPAVVER